MKVGFYILSWFITLFVGLIIAGALGGPELGLAFTAVAAALSAPFIIIFCVVMFIYIRKKPSRTNLHLSTFGLHATGSALTALAISLVEPGLPIGLYLAIFGYFAIDSLLFHYFVHTKHPESQLAIAKENNELLDDLRE